MLSRRDFLQRSSLVSLYPVIPLALSRLAQAAPAEADSKILVVIQLDGGNDGINTVVPFGDDGYGRNREALRLDAKQLHKLNDLVGLHPQMRAAKELFDDGRLTVVQGVGYPNPNRSHFESMRIWQTAQFDKEAYQGYGWLGRALDLQIDSANSTAPAIPGAIYAGPEQVPVALWGRRSEAVSLSSMSEMSLPFATNQVVPGTVASSQSSAPQSADDSINLFVTRQMISACTSAEQFQRQTASAAKQGGVEYPTTPLAANLQLISKLIQSDMPARVFYTVQSGYDTHAGQLNTHAQLLRELSTALKAFLDDLKRAQLDDRVVTLAFSEFGRRAKENDSQGTDHGAAGPVFLAGPKAVGGLVGKTPSMTDLADGDLKMQIDMRNIYSAILEDWLGVDAQRVLGRSFEKTKLFQA